MAATVLNSPRAVAVSVFVARAFVKLRHLALTHKELAELERKMAGHDDAIRTRLLLNCCRQAGKRVLLVFGERHTSIAKGKSPYSSPRTKPIPSVSSASPIGPLNVKDGINNYIVHATERHPETMKITAEPPLRRCSKIT
jgi:hypothetical protein